MLRLSLLIAAKDLRLLLFRSGAISQALLLGLLLIFVFSLSAPPGESASPEAAAAIFWLCSIFCQILIFTQLYALEEPNGVRDGLLMLPAPSQGIWLGKAAAGAILLLISQLVFLPAAFAFLNLSLAGPFWPGLAAIGCADLGICALGSLLGALSLGAGGRESLLSIVLFPLLIPLILAGIGLGAAPLGGSMADASQWLLIAASFDLVYLGAGLLLFGFIFQEGE